MLFLAQRQINDQAGSLKCPKVYGPGRLSPADEGRAIRPSRRQRGGRERVSPRCSDGPRACMAFRKMPFHSPTDSASAFIKARIEPAIPKINDIVYRVSAPCALCGRFFLKTNVIIALFERACPWGRMVGVLEGGIRGILRPVVVSLCRAGNIGPRKRRVGAAMGRVSVRSVFVASCVSFVCVVRLSEAKIVCGA